MNLNDLTKIEGAIDGLLQQIQQLQLENQALRHNQANLIDERGRLIEKNERARQRVEAIIQRLKAMEPA
ncbi:MAG: TIGR02449 family protein [Gammaproteobacteria bacterium]|nr:TIGR02449 family protein [Gammaproteobacteria bacterium]